MKPKLALDWFHRHIGNCSVMPSKNVVSRLAAHTDGHICLFRLVVHTWFCGPMAFLPLDPFHRWASEAINRAANYKRHLESLFLFLLM